MSQRRNNRSSNDTNFENMEESIQECVRYIICREGSKLPIKRAEILKHLSTVCQTTSNQINTVIIEANKILKNVST